MEKPLVKVTISTGLLILILFVLQLTIGTGVDGQGWNWKPNDFVFAFALFFGGGLAYEFFAARAANKANRIAIGFMILLGLAFVWINAVNDFDMLEEWVMRIIN